LFQPGQGRRAHSGTLAASFVFGGTLSAKYAKSVAQMSMLPQCGLGFARAIVCQRKLADQYLRHVRDESSGEHPRGEFTFCLWEPR